MPEVTHAATGLGRRPPYVRLDARHDARTRRGHHSGHDDTARLAARLRRPEHQHLNLILTLDPPTGRRTAQVHPPPASRMIGRHHDLRPRIRPGGLHDRIEKRRLTLPTAEQLPPEAHRLNSARRPASAPTTPEVPRLQLEGNTPKCPTRQARRARRTQHVRRQNRPARSTTLDRLTTHRDKITTTIRPTPLHQDVKGCGQPLSVTVV